MKTAISIPDELNETIEVYLKSARISRSHFFQRAAAAYLDGVAAKAITANLNSVYGDPDREDEKFRRSAISKLKGVIGREKW